MERLIRLVVILLLSATQPASGQGEPLFGSSHRPEVLMWQVSPKTSESDLAYLASRGVTLTQSFGIWNSTDDEIGTYLIALHKVGMRAVIYLNKEPNFANSCEFSDRALKFVEQNKGNPTIAAWLILDEPALHKISKACQRKLYRTIKNIDYNHLVMQSISMHTREDFDTYFTEDAFDILGIYSYVNPHPAERQKDQLDLLREVSNLRLSRHCYFARLQRANPPFASGYDPG